MRLRHGNGFTLMELIVASALFLSFIGLTTVEVVAVSRQSRRIAHGSGELMAAARMAEQFRDDVRQAQSARVSTRGDAVVLALDVGDVLYRVSAEQRLERVVNKSSEISSGPSVQRVFFALDGAGPDARRTLLHARWDCFAENDPLQDASDPARPAPAILILDTALRSEAGQVAQ